MANVSHLTMRKNGYHHQDSSSTTHGCKQYSNYSGDVLVNSKRASSVQSKLRSNTSLSQVNNEFEIVGKDSFVSAFSFS